MRKLILYAQTGPQARLKPCAAVRAAGSVVRTCEGSRVKPRCDCLLRAPLFKRTLAANCLRIKACKQGQHHSSTAQPQCTRAGSITNPGSNCFDSYKGHMEGEVCSQGYEQVGSMAAWLCQPCRLCCHYPGLLPTI